MIVTKIAVVLGVVLLGVACWMAAIGVNGASELLLTLFALVVLVGGGNLLAGRTTPSRAPTAAGTSRTEGTTVGTAVAGADRSVAGAGTAVPGADPPASRVDASGRRVDPLSDGEAAPAQPVTAAAPQGSHPISDLDSSNQPGGEPTDRPVSDSKGETASEHGAAGEHGAADGERAAGQDVGASPGPVDRATGEP